MDFSQYNTLKIDLTPGATAADWWSVEIFRFGEVEDNRKFPNEKEARGWLRRGGYPYSKAQVPVKKS